MSNSSDTYQVVIVGGGPVGLFLGICLEKAGIPVIILEERNKIRSGSRSLGIHPVSLELFQEVGIAHNFVEAGIKIFKGHAFANEQKLGTISFGDCPKPYNFILALPQKQTEHILEKSAQNLSSVLLRRGAKVTGINQKDEHIEVSYLSDGKSNTIEASFLVGCDGKDSFVRRRSGISFEGSNYPDTYIMGDFSDNTSLGSDAAIFLCDDGVIESFPLQGNRRRWVVKTSHYLSEVKRKDIERRVDRRIGHNLEETNQFMLSSFGVQKFVARPMVNNRIIVAGDAAHVVSPIGGQGMNLGWLGAWDLAQCMIQIFDQQKSPAKILEEFENRRQKAARNAIRRAEVNMRLGRKTRLTLLRNSLIYLMLHTPLSKVMGRIYTMRGLEKWIF